MGATPVDLPDAGDLPKLTHKQFAFVRAIAGGATQSDAYRQAYDCSNSTDPSVWCNASKFAADAKVMQWLCHLRRLGMAGARLTLEGHLSELRAAETCIPGHGQLWRCGEGGGAAGEGEWPLC